MESTSPFSLLWKTLDRLGGGGAGLEWNKNVDARAPAPKIWIWTSKIIPDLWFWQIKKNFHTPPYCTLNTITLYPCSNPTKLSCYPYSPFSPISLPPERWKNCVRIKTAITERCPVWENWILNGFPSHLLYNSILFYPFPNLFHNWILNGFPSHLLCNSILCCAIHT